MTTEKETKKTCPVTDILENLRAQLHTEGQLPAKARPAVARVARIVTEVTLGRGNIRNFEELAKAAKRTGTNRAFTGRGRSRFPEKRP